MNRKLLSIITFSFVSIAIISYQLLSQFNTQTVLEKYDLDSMSVIEMVNALDERVDEPSSLTASITPNTLVLYDNGEQFNFDLPDDQFYVSFAPYINSTHPCGQHNLVSCRGELKNETFHVIITKVDGTVIIDDYLTSMDSGFIGLWLPKDIEGTINIEYNDLSVESSIFTFDQSDTCITTPLQLKA